MADALITRKGRTGGGDILNGIIQEYLSNGDIINPNTFIEFVNKAGNPNYGTNNQLSSASSSLSNATADNSICAVSLDNNKIAIFYTKQSGSYLYGRIGTFVDNEIALSVETQLSTTAGSGAFMKGIKTTNGRIVITTGEGYAHLIQATSSSLSLLQTLTNIHGSSSFSLYGIVEASANMVFVMIIEHNEYQFQITRLDVTTTAITRTTFRRYTVSIDDIRNVIKISDGKIIAGCKSSAYPSVAIMNYTDTVPASISISRIESIIGTAHINLLDNNQIIATYQVQPTYGYYAIKNCIGTISGNTITWGTPIITLNESFTIEYRNIQTLKFNGTNIFVYYEKIMSNTLYCYFYKVSVINNTISYTTPETNTYRLINTYPHLNDNYLCYTVYSNYYLGCIGLSLQGIVKTSVSKIEGLTKTKCTDSIKGEIWVLP